MKTVMSCLMVIVLGGAIGIAPAHSDSVSVLPTTESRPAPHWYGKVDMSRAPGESAPTTGMKTRGGPTDRCCAAEGCGFGFSRQQWPSGMVGEGVIGTIQEDWASWHGGLDRRGE